MQGAYCPNCGFLSALLESNAADSPLHAATVTCSRCNAPLDSSERPARCLDCLGDSHGWWDTERNAWAQPDLRPSRSGASGVWVCGDFVGDLHSPVQARVGLTGAGRLLSATFHRGALSNLRRVSGPPQTLDHDESAPLRQALLQHVGVTYGAKETSISLNDFRLHRWSTHAIHEVEADAPDEMIQVLARVQGRAYAFIERRPDSSRPETLEHTTPEEARAADVREPTPETAPDPTPAPSPEATESETPSRPEDPSRTVTACFICDWRAQLVMAVLIGLSCSWLAALLWVLGVGRLMCAIDYLRASAGKGFGLEKPWWILGLFLMALAGYGLARLHPDPCSVLRIGSLALPLAAVLLGAWFKQCWFKSLLFVIWLATLQTGCGLGECRVEQTAASQSTQSTQNRPSPSTPNADAPPGFPARLGQGLSALKNRLNTLLSFDPTANALSQASEGDERGRRLSVNDAVADPSLLADCRNSVYFPGVAMFELNSAEINPAVHSQLVRMDRVLKAFPERQFLIVGHTDRTGQETPDGVYFNVMLSEQRAAAVARWLADNTAWPLERTEVRGAGGKFPILNVQGESALNRRVEIRLKCR